MTSKRRKKSFCAGLQNVATSGAVAEPLFFVSRSLLLTPVSPGAEDRAGARRGRIVGLARAGVA